MIPGTLPRRSFVAVIALLAAVAICACGSADGATTDAAFAPDTGASEDAGTHDAGHSDAGVDANDAGYDAGSDAGQDAGNNAGDYPPARAALVPLDGQPLFPVALDNRIGHYFVVDTGAARTAVETTLLRDVANGVGVVTIDFGAEVVLEDFEVLAVDLSEARDHIGAPIDGLIGQDLFKTMYFGIDYMHAEVTVAYTLPQSPPPAFSIYDAVEIPYTLVQELPVVDALVGAKPARLIADTGSGVTILTESFVEPALLASGLKGYMWYTSYGSDPATIVRLPSMLFQGAEVTGEWAVVVPDAYHLKPVFDALGIDVDGFLGYPVYRHFYVGVDGARSRYLFYPYAATPHIYPGEWDRVGVEIARDGGRTLVDMVFSPSDANDVGLMNGDEITAIGGAATASFTPDAIRLLLRGAPGETRLLTIDRDGDVQNVSVKVDALLPLP